uniref:Taste receptor type 2 n=1 Tax=Pelusios castaneus TaxID=367368 RepID=A0A8C8RTP6_9SAUR
MGDNNCTILKGDDVTASNIIVLIITLSVASVGMWINSFIVAVNCIEHIKHRCLSSNDNILAAVATSRFCFLFKTMLRIFYSTFYPWIYYKSSVLQAFRAVTWFLNSSNQWFAACLCAFYCVKIANFSHPLFICLKFKISKLVPWLLLASVLLSFSINYKMANVTVQTAVSAVLLICGTGFSMAFTIFIISALLLLFSLWRHTWHMQNNSSSFRSPRMEAHIQAMKTIMSFFIFNAINFIILLILLTDIFPENGTANVICTTVSDVCLSVHSVILILSNPKLKKILIKVLHYVKNARVRKMNVP